MNALNTEELRHKKPVEREKISTPPHIGETDTRITKMTIEEDQKEEDTSQNPERGPQKNLLTIQKRLN